MRKFVSQRAVRANVPLLIALIGPSTSGKTYSAHRLAKGIARVQPGPVYGIDTENKGTRMLEVADKFDFTHMPFEAPFGSLDYLAAIEQAAREGARTVIVDSMSHEHEGPGGCLDAADQFVEKKIANKVRYNDLPNADCKAADDARARLNKSKWIIPKSDRGKLIQGMQQLNINLILCFRAKPKMDPNPGKDDSGKVKEFSSLGFQPIAGDEFWYEMTTRFFLPPGACGMPQWTGLEKGEKAMARRPEQFLKICRDGAIIDEAMGEQMARWATGNGPSMSNVELDAAAIMAKVNACATREELQATSKEAGALPWSDAQRKAIKATVDARAAALKGNQ